MRKLGILVLCVAFWLVGYYCGRSPGSPDILGWMYQQIQPRDSSADGRD